MTVGRSIAQRLAAALAAAVLGAFAVSGVMFYGTIESELRERAQAILSGRFALVEHLIQESSSDTANAALWRALDDALLESDNLRIWVREPRGRTIFGPSWIDAPLDRQFVRVTDERGAALDYLAGRVDRPGGPLEVAVGRDAGPDDELLAELASALAVECLIGALAAALLANWIVRRGLRPIDRLAREAAAVSVQTSAVHVDETDLALELKPLARSFNAAVSRMHDAYRQMEAFNANVAHELRTPIANLSGAMQVALSRPRTVEAWRSQAQASLEDVDRLAAIVNDMLFLARADAGDLQRRSDAVDLASEAVKVAEYFEAATEDARLGVRIAGNATVQADAALLRRAISNLLANALRHATAGTEILIRVECTPHEVRCAVVNAGEPIDAERLPRLFDRFFRSGHARSSNSSGSGLGLSIVRAVARMHGGNVFAASEGGRTTIGFTLAAAAQPSGVQPDP